MIKRKIAKLLICAALLQGCASHGENTIYIGAVAPLTGTSSAYGTACANGIRLAVNEINKNGGVLGKQLVVDIQDEKGGIEETINAYNRLVGNGAGIIIGDVMSKPCLAIADLAEEDGTLLLTPAATADEITEGDGNIFRVCFTDEIQGKIMARYAADDLEADRIAVMYNISDDYSEGISESFCDELENIGISPDNVSGYGNDDKDFRVQLSKIISKSPDVIFVPDYYSNAALIVSQARELGYRGNILGADGWDGILSAISENNFSILDKCRYSAHYSPDDQSPSVRHFVNLYEKEYKTPPTSLSALGYDAVYIIKSAIEHAGSEDKYAVAQAMREIETQCVTGNISFDEKGNPLKEVSVISLTGGQPALDTKKELS